MRSNLIIFFSACLLLGILLVVPSVNGAAMMHRGLVNGCLLEERRQQGPRQPTELAVMLPGDPMVTGTLSQGVINGISIFSNIILAR